MQAPKVSLLLQKKTRIVRSANRVSRSIMMVESMGHFLLTVVFDRERSDRNVDDGGNIRGCC